MIAFIIVPKNYIWQRFNIKNFKEHNWNEETKTVLIPVLIQGKSEISLTFDFDVATVNGESEELGIPAKAVNG